MDLFYFLTCVFIKNHSILELTLIQTPKKEEAVSPGRIDFTMSYDLDIRDIILIFNFQKILFSKTENFINQIDLSPSSTSHQYV